MGHRLDAATVIEALANAVRTATVNGSAIDVKDFDKRIGFILSSAIMTAGDTLDVKIQQSTDGSTGWTDVTGATFTQVTAAADAFETIFVDTEATQRYLRVVGTIAGASPSVAFCVSLFGNKQVR